MNEFEPAPATIEAMHLAGQEELRFCMMAIADLTMQYPNTVPVADLEAIQDRLLDRHQDLNMEAPNE